ncbi:MAG: DEAD/DEAH box helicase family protein [Fimbriimonas ginsengisoli]|uniref:DEAD/DEAH box helicase family protein n=1 Tax=Fimbriimonas ginsengisoli TaxID=1005039 RepID=A0A931LS93_FIMGI|nr:DEAD/DEAH box helicase family protein [Fimbriimonas ginsengisoli]
MQAVGPMLDTTLATLIDNRAGNTLLEALRRLIPSAKALDLATGYFEVGALVELDGVWQGLDSLRILMGDESSRRSKSFIVQALTNPQANGLEWAKENDDLRALDGLSAIEAALQAGAIQAKVYTQAKFHAKAYHLYTGGAVNHGIIGSSNFTRPGLTQNLELNLFTSDKAHLTELATWFDKAWKEAEDVREDLTALIRPHTRPYFPFEVYLQAMRERFFGLEPEEATWEHQDSRVYPILAQYQRDAYHDLRYMAERWGGALLCDGVGLGKTFVALMLIERCLKDRKRVLVIAPKAAIPSVWNRNLARFFPDDFDANPEYQHDIRVLAHTDLGRDGGVTPERLRALRERYDVIIVDEAHHFRVPSRNRSLKLKELAKDKQLFMLTATPINNSALDLYVLLNYVAQDRQRHFQTVNVPQLRGWFAKRLGEGAQEQLSLDLGNDPGYHEFLKHVLVQRSRRYVKSLDIQEDSGVKFPERERPEVVTYSLKEVYGSLLPRLLAAFSKGRANLKLVIYETERFKEQNAQDSRVLGEQSNVVGLIRTMLLKRLESSQKALEASIEDLLFKHLVLLKELWPLKYEPWLAQYAGLNERLEQHRREKMGADDDEEEDELPLTTFESKKLAQVKADIHLIGKNEAGWVEGLEADTKALSEILLGLHEVTRPENDAKLHALFAKIDATKRLRTDKFVIFSEFKDTARYLEVQLKKRLPNDAIIEVDSGRHVSDREKIIKRFAPHYNCENEEDVRQALKDPIRVMISTDVLSEGLNLQDANIIVNYDLHWNPVRLMQRIGRVDRRMDPTKPVDYERVYVYNFLPPKELDDVLGLFQTITGKLVAINRTLGIEAPVLSAQDDFKAMDFYLNLGEGTLSVVEELRLKAHELSRDYPELWQASTTYPNRIYSGKGEGPGEKLFLCYRIVTGYDPEAPERRPTFDVRWMMVDCASGEISEDLGAIHEAIACVEGTPRELRLAPEDRTRLRRKVEAEVVSRLRFQSQIPAQVDGRELKDELVCWMEVG